MTLFRFEHGERVRDHDSFVRIAGCLGLALEELTTGQDEAREAPFPNADTTPETVARVLRADDSLGPEKVETLMVTFRALYARLQVKGVGVSTAMQRCRHRPRGDNYVFEKGLNEQKPPEDTVSETCISRRFRRASPAWHFQCIPVT
jgi:hypothetical protein